GSGTLWPWPSSLCLRLATRRSPSSRPFPCATLSRSVHGEVCPPAVCVGEADAGALGDEEADGGAGVPAFCLGFGEPLRDEGIGCGLSLLAALCLDDDSRAQSDVSPVGGARERQAIGVREPSRPRRSDDRGLDCGPDLLRLVHHQAT